MKKTTVITLALSCLLSLAVQAGKVVGYNKFVVPPNTDVGFSVPFTGKKVFHDENVTGSGVNITTTKTLADDYGDGTYYVKILSTGKWSTIVTANASSTAIEVEDPTFADGIAGETIEIRKHQTLSSLFPSQLEGRSFFSAQTEILSFEGANDAVNRSAMDSFMFFSGYGWFISSTGALDSDRVLDPDTYYIFRNNGPNQLEVFTLGNVNFDPISVKIPTVAVDNDLLLNTGLPIAAKITDLGLENVMKLSSLALEDELLLYDQSQTGMNKSVIDSLTLYDDGQGNLVWLSSVHGLNIENIEILPSHRLILRRKAGTPSEAIWTHNLTLGP